MKKQILSPKISLIRKLIFPILLLAPTLTFAWHTIEHPSSGPTEIYGSYANGCFNGGITIPTKQSGYEQVRPSRNRNYGAPAIYEFTKTLNQFGTAQNKIIILGDIAQPRGGPANFGHASHQTGLDMDIWLEDRQEHLSNHLREKLNTPSVASPTTGTINSHWKPFYRELLFQAATYAETERIFVNPVIKAHLCQTETDTAWLEKLRPWYGHDSHFHVRLKCPTNSVGCIAQAPIPKGDGCDSNLQNWVKDQIAWSTAPKTNSTSSSKPKPKKIMPVECQSVLRL